MVYCLTCEKCPSTVYNGETGCRMADLFREHRRDKKVAVLKVGLVNQQHRKKQEMRYIFKHGTLAPSGLNHNFSFT